MLALYKLTHSITIALRKHFLKRFIFERETEREHKWEGQGKERKSQADSLLTTEMQGSISQS